MIALLGSWVLASLPPGAARAQICDDRFPSTCEKPAVQEAAPPSSVPQRLTAPRKPSRAVSDERPREVHRSREAIAVSPADEPAESSTTATSEERTDGGLTFAEAASAINATGLAGLPAKTALATSRRQSLVLAATTAWIGQPFQEHMIVAADRSHDTDPAATVRFIAEGDDHNTDLAAEHSPDRSSWMIFLMALLSGTLLLALAGWLLVARKPLLAVLPRRRHNGDRSALRPRFAP
jgi:hypothetical protein